MTITTALLYTRVSTDEQATHGLSLPVQLAECRQYVLRQPDWAIGHEYSDVLSGSKDSRRDYQALLAHVRELRGQGQRVAVVVAALDRFGRRVLERVRSREELKKLGVPTHSVREGGEVSDLVANILASVAEEETRRLAERVKATRAHLRATGWKPPGRAALGYRWREPTKEEKAAGAPSSVLDVDPMTADTIVEMFERAAQGQSIHRIQDWMHALPAALRGNLQLAVTVVSTMLRAPVYVARSDHGDADVLTRPLGRWPALISDELWLAVQQRLAGHQQFPNQATGRYLLTGFFRCPLCGFRVTGTRNYHALKYRCGRRDLGHQKCVWAIDVRTIDTPLLRAVEGLLRAVETIDHHALAEEWRNLGTPDDGERRQRVAALKREIATAKAQLLRATQLYVDGAIDAMSYELTRDRSQETIAGAETESARIGADVRPVLPDLRLVLRDLAAADTFRTAPIANQREVLKAILESVDVRYEVRPGKRTGRYHVTPRWTPLGAILARL